MKDFSRMTAQHGINATLTLARLRFHSSMEMFCFQDLRMSSRWSQTVGMGKGVVVQAVWSRYWRGVSTPLLCWKSGVKVWILCIWHRYFHPLQNQKWQGPCQKIKQKGTKRPRRVVCDGCVRNQGCCYQICSGVCAMFKVGTKPPR